MVSRQIELDVGLKIVILHKFLPSEDHAVLAVYVDGEWLILDDNKLALVREAQTWSELNRNSCSIRMARIGSSPQIEVPPALMRVLQSPLFRKRPQVELPEWKLSPRDGLELLAFKARIFCGCFVKLEPNPISALVYLSAYSSAHGEAHSP